MSHSEFAIAGLYDHEQETDRRAPDWGGDDLFTAIPRRRRFERAAPAERAASAGRDASAERPAPAVRAALAERPAPSAVGLVADTTPAALRTSIPTATAPTGTVLDRYAEPVPAGRRTVTITGHPGALAVRPRRPGRSLDERLATHPERIAAWAFGMGLLLIFIAIATGQG